MSTGENMLLYWKLKREKEEILKYFHKSVHPAPLFYVIYGVEVKVFQKYRNIYCNCKLFMNKFDILY
jgi:hypothetical protein